MDNQISAEAEANSYNSLTTDSPENYSSMTPESITNHVSVPNNIYNVASGPEYVSDQHTEPQANSGIIVSGHFGDGQPGLSQPDIEYQPGYNDNIWTVGSEINKMVESNGEVCRMVTDTECDFSNIGSVSNSAQDKQIKLRKYSWNADCLLVSVIGVAVVLFAYTVAKLVMGSIYLTKCELEPLLPIFLIADSCVALLYFTMPYFYTKGQNENKPKFGQWKFPLLFKLGCGITIVLLLFHTIWLIFGTLIVVETRNTIYNSDHCMNLTTSQPIKPCLTCSESLADFTLIIVAIQWVIVGLVILIATLFTCCVLYSTCAQ